MKLIVIGGHLAPALAVIEALPKGTDILFVGRQHTFEGDKGVSLEYKKITALGIPFQSLNTGRFQRKLTRHTLLSLLKLPWGLVQARRLLLDFKPDVVLGFGGYLQIPVAYAAFNQKIPIVIHEQTLNAGLANIIVGKYASRVCISWKESEKYFPEGKTVLTGNPLRREFFESVVLSNSEESQRDSRKLYVTGGSAGSHAINVLVEGCLDTLLDTFCITHQTGDAHEFGDYERLEKKRRDLPKDLRERYALTKFIDPNEVAGVLSSATIVVSRSGMNTICELLYLGKPCLLIPLPYGQKNEQLTNALLVQKTGIGVVAKQEELTSESFYSQIMEILATLDKYENCAKEAKALIRTDAAEKIVEAITGEAKHRPQNSPRGKHRIKQVLFFLVPTFIVCVGILVFFILMLIGSLRKPLFVSPLSALGIQSIRSDSDAELHVLEDLLKKHKIDYQRISRIPDSAYLIRVENEGEILVSFKKDIYQQTSSLQYILSRLKMEGKHFVRLDLRYEKPVVILQDKGKK